MKLLLFIYCLSSGGAERAAINLANYWAKKGWQITIITIAGIEQDFYPLHPEVNRIALSLDTNSHNILTAIKGNYSRIKALRKVLKQQQPDIALAMMTTANVLLGLAAKGLGIPVVGSEQNHPPMFSLGCIWEWLRKQSYGQLDVIVALTKESAEWLKLHTKAQKIEIIPNAVTYPIVSHEPKVRPDISVGSFNLIAVGRLVEQKGHDRLLSAFAELAPRFPDWHLTILGEGDCRKSLEQQRSELGLEERVSMPGVVGNLGDWYQAADLYVMTSLYEGFPNTLGEAMAYGLPAVSVDCDTGPRDIICHQIDGLLVPQGDAKSLIKALATLMENRSLREQYAARGIEARDRFSIERIAGMWEQLFTKVKL